MSNNYESKYSLSAIIQLLNPDNTISAHRMLAHAIGMTETIIYSALISKQTYYLNNNMLHEGGWFFSTIADLQESTTFGAKAQKTAIGNLTKHGLIECECKGMPAKRYFRITNDMEILMKLIDEGTEICKKISAKSNRKRDDFERISLAAKKYFTVQKLETENVLLRDKCTSLENRNEKLKNDNAVLSGNLKQLENDFDRFYSSVEDEIALQNENNRLSLENSRLGNQVHILQNKNAEIENTLVEKDNKLTAINKELSQTKSLLKSLQEKINKIMRFIEQYNLIEKLEAFLKSVQHRSR